jgi:hypothetical protein
VKLYFDLDTSQFIDGPGFRNPVESLKFKRGDTCSIIVQFVREAVAQELAIGATGVFGLKAVGAYDSGFVAAAPSWVKSGTGATALYTFNLNLATDELNALLGVGAGADVASVELNAEMEFVAAGVRTSSPTILATVENDVIRGDEAGPTDITAGTPVNATYATAYLEVDVNPTDGQTLILTSELGVENYRFKNTPTLSGDIQIHASINDTATAIATMIGDSDAVEAAVSSGNQVALTATVIGSAGDFTLTGTASGDLITDEIPAIDSTPGRGGTMKVSATHLYVVASVTDGVPLWRKIAHSAL